MEKINVIRYKKWINMSVINGGEVIGLNTTTINQMFNYDRYKKRLLLKHRSKHFAYLAERLAMVNRDLQELLEFIRLNVSVSWYKAVKGRLVGFILVMYMEFHLFSQQYAHKGNLIFYANYFYIVQYLQRLVKVMILNYDYPNKFYKFHMTQNRLLKFSEYCYDETYDVCRDKMIPHYNKLMLKD